MASPILGTEHFNNRIIKFSKKLRKLTSKLPVDLLKHVDDFNSQLQKSLSDEHQKRWFLDHHELLPKNLFYTALALESRWFEGHIWMMITKLIFQSDKPNDGVVDGPYALYPECFDGINLGVLPGHHLIGNRSSFYSQEALLEAQIIFLQYKKLI